MKKNSNRFRAAAPWLGAVAAFFALAQPTFAQVPARLPGDDKGMLQWAMAVGILVLFSAVVFMNPKRSHQN